MKAACLPGRQGGKGLLELFHHQGAGGLLFPFRFLLHQNILRGNGLLREMVFHAGGCVQRVTVIMLFGVIGVLCAAFLYNGVCHLVRHFHKGVFLTNRVVVFFQIDGFHRPLVHFRRSKYRRSRRSAAWMDFPAWDGVMPSIAAMSFTFIPSIYRAWTRRACAGVREEIAS